MRTLTLMILGFSILCSINQAFADEATKLPGNKISGGALTISGTSYQLFVTETPLLKSTGERVMSLYQISLLKNGKTLPPDEVFYGDYNFLACQRSFDDHDPMIRPLVWSDKSKIGWEIRNYQTCAGISTPSLTTYVIKKDEQFNVQAVHSHGDPVLINTKDGFEVWWTYQELGARIGSEADYVEVPRRMMIKNDGTFNLASLPDDYHAWPKRVLNSEIAPNYFVTIFTAGMIDHHVKVMQTALNELYKPTDTTQNSLKALGLPPKKESLQDLISSFSKNKHVFDAFFPVEKFN